MKNLNNYYVLIKQMGLNWFLYRSFYEFQKKTGIIERKTTFDLLTFEELNNLLNKQTEKEQVKKQLASFFVNNKSSGKINNWMENNLNEEQKEGIIKVADAAIKGKIICFSRWFGDYGDPIDWHLNPVTGKRHNNDYHWTQINELTPGEDIKFVWEVSRFPQVYYFSRAYILTGEDKYAEAFWSQVEDWWENNPPCYGPNWFCGQELALRAMTWIFGLFVFWDSTTTSSQRILNIIRYIWAHGTRIENNIDFAIKALKNNHGISEAAGLFTIGVLFPFLKESKRWVNKSLNYLNQEGIRQIYSDGSYIQNSMNYQRMVVQLYSWCLRIAQMNNITFNSELLDRLEKCVVFLYSMQEQKNGYLPNYGSNDGALPFILSVCDYSDYRSQLNTLWSLLKGKRLYNPGLYDEELLWFLGGDLKNLPLYAPKAENAFNEGGYYILRGDNSWGFTRCTTFRDRPGHADMLHFDLWVQGENILTDAGSYSYNAPGWSEYFSGTASHNTVIVNDQDQMKKWRRFMWLNWTRSKLNAFEEENNFTFFEEEHYGYNNLVHRRCIINREDFWVVIDDILSESNNGEEHLKLHWLLGKFPWNNNAGELQVSTGRENILIYVWPQDKKTKLSIDEGVEDPQKRGWSSLYYGVKEKVPSMVLETNTFLPYRFITLVSLKDQISDYGVNEKEVHIKKQDKSKIDILLGSVGEKGILKSIEY